MKRYAIPSAAALLWSVSSSMYVYPHSLSYFNELAGGPERGSEHLLHSNIDWGQDLLYLKEWLGEHAAARPVRLAYFGPIDPQWIGIEFELPPKGPPRDKDKLVVDPNQYGPQPGWYAISVNVLRGDRRYVSDGSSRDRQESDYTYFAGFRPVGRAGYSIYIYYITLDEANRVRRKLGLPELPSDPPPETEGDA